MLTQWNQNLEYYLKEKESSEEGSIKYNQAVERISVYKNNIEDLNSFPNIEINNQKDFSALVDKEQALIEFFEAGRRSDILNVKSASAINYDQNELKNSSIDIGNKLEQHLVNLYTRRSFAISNKADDKLESSITKWLNKFISNLKFLMEDDSVDLEFNVDDFKLYIKQNEKEKYTFQNLSSGYSSIFNIFSRLLMRAEYLKVPPNKLSGIVIIDEIDAHLHVSLQKKILPFLSESFSRIQFIVTTHSPFVLTSISTSVIYDISSKEQVENLSSYSYEAILEGLFNVTSASKLLQDKIESSRSCMVYADAGSYSYPASMLFSPCSYTVNGGL
jgi:predicted ATP-binding protein involved in virulence